MSEEEKKNEASNASSCSSSAVRGLSFSLRNIEDARRRLSALLSSNGDDIRSFNEIWEIFFDVETAIAMSKYLFGAFNRLGKPRRISVSAKEDDPTSMPLEKLRARLQSIDSKLATAAKKLQEKSGDEAIELARKARDELKVMLLAYGRSSQRRKK